VKRVSWEQSRRGSGSGAGALLPFLFCAVNLCRALLDTCSGWARHGIGGAMAEEEDDSGSEKDCVEDDWSGVRSDGGPDPKNGRVKGRLLLKEAATTALDKYVDDVIKNIVGNIKGGHLPSMKLLMDMADHLESKNPTAADFESFARLLMKEFLTEQGKLEEQEKTKEQEARMTISGERGSLVVEPCGE